MLIEAGADVKVKDDVRANGLSVLLVLIFSAWYDGSFVDWVDTSS